MTPNFRISHLNICSLKYKVHEVSSLLNKENLHVLTISETRLDTSVDDDQIAVSGYCVHRKDRNGYGGGVAIYIQSHIPMNLREDLMDPSVEMLWMEIHLPSSIKPLLLGCCYRRPKTKIKDLDKICSILQKASEHKGDLYCLGDFNVNWLSETCNLKRRLSKTADKCGLSQLMNLATRVSNWAGMQTKTCIDLIFTNVKELVPKAKSIPVGFSDHNLVVVTTEICVPELQIRQRSFGSFREPHFKKDIKQVEWSRVCETNNVEEALQLFTELFSKVADKHAPVITATVKARKPAWMDKKHEDLMVKRDKEKNQAIESAEAADWESYRSLNKKVTSRNRNKIKKNNESEKLQNSINDILRRYGANTPYFIKENGTFISEALDIANHFNQYFLQKTERLRTSHKMAELHEHSSMTDGVFDFQSVNVELVQELLKDLNCKKPSGLDDLDGKLLHSASGYISKPICHIMNLSLTQGVFPEAWKAAKVIPLPKNQKKTFTCANSRPISILPVLSELMERVVFDQVSHFLPVNELQFQHTKRTSSRTALGQSSETNAVLLLFSARFDRIDHEILLKKLDAYGFNRCELDWMRSYLTGRTQRVFFNCSFSESSVIKYGVPQASCLRPLLFSIFTNDMQPVLREPV